MVLYITPKTQQYTLFKRDISDWKPYELARAIINDRDNNLTVKRLWGGKILLEYRVEVCGN